jgi:tetratricopeptide (TPR) repeat protein
VSVSLLASRSENAASTATRECVLGMEAQEAGNAAVAIAHFEAALRLAPMHLDIRLLLAFALGSAGATPRARALIDATPNISLLEPADLRRLADAATQVGAIEGALAAVQRLVAVTPNDADLQSTLGALLHRRGALTEAAHVLQRAVLRWPTHVPSLLNSAHLLVAGGGHHEALRNYDRVLRVAPLHHAARWHRGMLRLMLGDFAGGWADCESRRHLPVHTMGVPQGIPAWNGRNAKNRTVLLWGEQGLGDQIQGVRFAARLAALGARVIVRCAAPLRELFTAAGGVTAVVGELDPLPACDAHVPMLSVPFLLKLFDESAYDAGAYLRAPFAAESRANPRPAALKNVGAVRVGVAWAGSPGHINDARRSLPTDLLHSLVGNMSVEWVSLQLGARSSEFETLPGVIRSHISDAAATIHDFTDSARIVATLDRVVTVDTALAHLAGALGIPTLLMTAFVPDWRWQLVREDSPWYRSVIVLRQPSAGDWHSVIERVHRELAAGGSARLR